MVAASLDGIQNECQSHADKDELANPRVLGLQSSLASPTPWIEFFADDADKDEPATYENLKPIQGRLLPYLDPFDYLDPHWWQVPPGTRFT